MTDISPVKVKELREKTGAGMMDCKKALTETKGDFEAAVDWLRKKGVSGAAKKAGRVAAEGLVGIASGSTNAAIVELNSETDFVAKNEKFQQLVKTVAGLALSAKGDLGALKKTKAPSGKTVEELVVENIATIGENLTLRRSAYMEVKQGVVATYLHNAVGEGLGKIGVLVAIESAGDKAKLLELGRQIAMHVAATRPESTTSADLDQALIERERQIFAEQARASGKPENIIEKMIEGRIRKFYEEVVLLEQVFVIDGKTRVKEAVENAAKAIGSPVKVAGFVRFALGEGVEKEEKNFAEEVAAAAGQR
jgi:elongation factor Ts